MHTKINQQMAREESAKNDLQSKTEIIENKN
jgi:hypothetical protein